MSTPLAGSTSITLGNSLLLHLLPQRAVWLPGPRALLVADVHLGKAASFRRQGVPVPRGTTRGNLERLDELLTALAPVHQLVVLGDLIHSAQGRTPALLQTLRQWRAQHGATVMTLVRGNHDDRAGDPPAELCIEVVDEPCLRWGLALCHDPATPAPAFRLAGHVHPVLWLGQGIDRLRLPCFVETADSLLLPAFGEFTGGWEVAPAPGQRLHALAPDRVWTLPTP
jgi:DNA ligase-associated metallophosphoesterase